MKKISKAQGKSYTTTLLLIISFSWCSNNLLTSIVNIRARVIMCGGCEDCGSTRHVRILPFSDSRFTMIHLTQTGFNSLLIHLLPKFSKVQLPIHLVGKSILKNRFRILAFVWEAFTDSILWFSVALQIQIQSKTCS